MSSKENQRREFTAEEIEESERLAALQESNSDYWTDVFLKRKAILTAVHDGVLKPREIRFFKRELKKLEN